MIQRRIQENRPDLTFDLDEDGAVGPFDLVMSKRFDTD